MKRGIIVVHEGHASKDEQHHQLNDVDEVVAITPMTAEDWDFQLADAVKDLTDGDQVHIGALHYFGSTLGAIAHHIDSLTTKGITVVVDGDNLTDSGMAAAIRALVKAESDAAYARVAHLKKVAEGRRTATPPKCIFVPVELLNK